MSFLLFVLLNMWLWSSYANTCPKYKLRESCYQTSYCFWNSISKGCSVLPDLDCVDLPISEDCYEFEDCFWHGGLGSCQNVSGWTLSTGPGETTSEQPVVSSQTSSSSRGTVCPPNTLEDPCWMINGCFYNRRSMVCEKLPTGSQTSREQDAEFDDITALCSLQTTPTSCLNQNNLCYFQSGRCKAIMQIPAVGSRVQRPPSITTCEDLSYEYCEGTQIGSISCIWDGNECDEAEQLETVVLGRTDPNNEEKDPKSRAEEWFWIPSIFAVSFIGCFAILLFASRKPALRVQDLPLDKYDELHDPEAFEWMGDSKITVED